MMSLYVALQNAGAARPNFQPRPIRRKSWVPGTRIQWDIRRSRWIFGNVFRADLLTSDRFLGCENGDLSCGCDDGSQGCLTPESMLADDWEVYPEPQTTPGVVAPDRTTR